MKAQGVREIFGKTTRIRLILVVLSISFGALAGCVSLPVEEVRIYSEAFQEARQAGEVMLDKVAPYFPNSSPNQQGCTRGSRAFPKKFCPEVALLGDKANEPAAIKTRRLALQTTARFNAILVGYAEGKPAADLKGQINEFAQLATLLVPLAGLVPSAGLTALPAGFGLAAGKLGNLAALIEQRRSQAIARQAIIDAVPAIQELLKLLAEDTPDLFNIYLAGRQLEKSPLLQTIGDAKSSLKSKPANAAILRNTIKQSTQQIKAINADINQFHINLTLYVKVLDETGKALGTLALAAQNPTINQDGLRALIKSSIEIRDAAGDFWKSVRGAT